MLYIFNCLLNPLDAVIVYLTHFMLLRIKPHTLFPWCNQVKVLLKLKEQEDKRRREAEEAEEQRKMGLKLVKEKERRLKEGVQAAEEREEKVEVDPAILAARDKYDKIKQRELAEELEAAQTMARAAGKPIDKKKNQGYTYCFIAVPHYTPQFNTTPLP
jgi:hypothetical protein